MEGLLLIRDLAVVLLVAALVGALFRKLGLSVVVGYLAAGMIVGPYTPPFTLVSDIGRIETLSQLGLVFLMFFVGLGLSLRRLRRLGFPLLFATAITALLVFTLSRCLAAALGWTPGAGLFLGAMLMVSSSAIMTKTLSEAGMTHEKFAQRAMGMTVLEDVVAVVMLTVLAAQVMPNSVQASASVGKVLGMLGGFVALLVVAGLLIIPGFLRRVARTSDVDLRVSAVAGVILGAAFLAAWAGYSVALGAFLLGMIVAETPFRDRIERAFTGLQGMFAVVFFVSIGMMIDLRLLLHHWAVILGVAAFAIVARVGGATGAHLLTGRPLTGAMRTALVVTPIGEFSYIIAQIGVSGHAVPDFFYGLAVGVSAVTAFTAPILLRFSEPLVEWTEARQPGWLRRNSLAYRVWLETLLQSQTKNSAWILLRGRIKQVILEVLLLIGVLGFSSRLQEVLHGALADVGFSLDWNPIFWTAVFCVGAALAVAVWRNMAAIAMILSEAAFGPSSKWGAVAEKGVRVGTAAALLFLFWLLLPLPVSGWGSVGILMGGAILFVTLFWRRLVRWHSRFLYAITGALQPGPGRSSIQTGKSVNEEEWGVDLVEVSVPEGAAYVGRSLRDLALRNQFGATVVEIERQGFEIPNPNPDLALYSGDKVLILGKEEEIARTRAFLERSEAEASPDFAENALETVVVSPQSSRLGRSLADLRIFNETGVQVLGIRRAGVRLLNPGAFEVLQEGDELLILASPSEFGAFQEWLMA